MPCYDRLNLPPLQLARTIAYSQPYRTEYSLATGIFTAGTARDDPTSGSNDKTLSNRISPNN